MAGDQVTVSSSGDKLEGRIHDGKIEVEYSGKNGPPMRMTGTVEGDSLSGDYTRGDRTGKWKATRLPVRRVGRPTDIANAALFLMTTPFATGSTVRVDGGGVIA